MEREKKIGCQITRVGTVEQIDNDLVILNIEGKKIKVPMVKVMSSVKVGDAVKWNGERWVKQMV